MDPENRSTTVQLPHFDFDACDESLVSCKKKTITIKKNNIVGAPSAPLSTDQQVIERSSNLLLKTLNTSLHSQEQSSGGYNLGTVVNTQLSNKPSSEQVLHHSPLNGGNFGVDINYKEKISTDVRQSFQKNESALQSRKTSSATSYSTFVSKVSSLSSSKTTFSFGPSSSSSSSMYSMKKNIGNVPATEVLQSPSGSSTPSLTTSNSLYTSGTKRSCSDSEEVKKTIPVFEHILLLPPSYHKSSKEESLPSNYLTPEEEAIQARQLWNRHQKRIREEKKLKMKRYQESTKEQSSDDEYEVGRSGRRRKKPKLFSDYFMEKPKQANDQIEVEEVYDSPDFETSDDDDDSDTSDDFDEESSILSSDDDFKMSSSSLLDNIERTTSKKQSKTTFSGVRTNSELNWNLQIKALKRFKINHGHTRVSQRTTEDPSLARWVKKVREKYKKVQKGHQVPSLSSDRISQLNNIGFVWVVRDSDFNLNFEQHLTDLLEFKRKHGHTRVPHEYDDNPKLGRWCHHIKLSYKQFMKGEKPVIKINQAHIDKLHEIGFQWKIRHVLASSEDGYNFDFDQGFMKLKAFQTLHGHCDVPLDFPNQNLLFWVNTVISSYRQMKEDKRPIVRLSNLQIKLLDDIDFDWSEDKENFNDQTTTNLMSWSERYKQLCQYKARFGNCRVPNRYDDDKQFGNWVVAQRKALGHMAVGRSPKSLTDEQRRKLEDIGLEWTVYRYDTDNGCVEKKGRKSKKKRSTERAEEKTSKLEGKSKKNCKRKHNSQGSPQTLSKRQKTHLENWMKKLRIGFEWEKVPNRVVTMQSWCQELNIGFQFEEIKRTRSTYRVSKRFETYVSELKSFKSKHGHMNVTTKMDRSLSTWISNIRTSYKRIHDGRPPLIKLTEDRMQSLKNINFDFRSHIRLKNRGPRFLVASTETIKQLNNECKVSDTNNNAESSITGIKMEEWCKNLALGFAWINNEHGSATRLQQIFEARILELKAFKAVHGHMNVGTKVNKPLNAWISRIRMSYKKIQEGEIPPVKLTEARLKSLKEINFDFVYRKKGRPPQVLTCAPAPSPPKKPNNIEVDTKEISHNPNSDLKENNLNQNFSDWCKSLQLGFLWDTQDFDVGTGTKCKDEPFDGRSTAQKTFDTNVQELKTFKTIHGHINVPQKTNKSLHAWIRNIRMTYKRVQEGKSPLIRLTEERLQQLQELDFTFVSPEAGSREQRIVGNLTHWCKILNLGFEWSSKNDNVTQTSWTQKHFDTKLNELKSFIALHGHMNVSPKTNKSLHYWISNVKSSYNRIQEGKSPLIKLTDERLESLKKVGFPFKASSRRRKQFYSANTTPVSFSTKPITMRQWCSCLGLGFEFVNETTQTTFAVHPDLVRKSFDQHLEDFKLYRETHGITSLSTMAKNNKALSNWCRNIRSSYSRISSGRSPRGLRLTAENIEKLKSVGFEFSTRKR